MYFPHPLCADQDGLLAIGGDLSVERLLFAYRYGIFPWFNEEPIMWWWTHPRCILYPKKVKVAKSMRSYFNQKKYTVTFNKNFDQVIYQCATTQRTDQMGTWINKDMITAYIELHKLGYAHSVEVWQNNALVGGLYGIGMGHVFFGESMFAKAKNASKFGLITLCRRLSTLGTAVIDCQQETDHLKSLGAEMISKDLFWSIIMNNQNIADQPIPINLKP